MPPYYLPFDEHEAVERRDLLHWKPERVPAINLEHPKRRLRHLPRRDALSGSGKLVASNPHGSVDSLDHLARALRPKRRSLWRRRRNEGRVLDWEIIGMEILEGINGMVGRIINGILAGKVRVLRQLLMRWRVTPRAAGGARRAAVHGE